MLPLWIIDITNESERREKFFELLRKIEHVYIDPALTSDSTDDQAEPHETPADYGAGPADTSGAAGAGSGDASSVSDSVQKKSQKEQDDEEEKRKAAREAKVKGNYWFYSRLSSTFGQELSEEHTEALDAIIAKHNSKREQAGIEPLDDENVATYHRAMELYSFQEQMIADGKRFVEELRRSNARPYQPINVIVLGDASEVFTQMVFPSIAAILQKEKGRFLPVHIHQGMTIYGSLYIPCDVNARKVSERKTILHLLDEIEVQHDITAIRGYDHMMLYQNVQNRTECTYTLLDGDQQAQYLLQCVVHLFLACDINHPLISGTRSDDCFYFSMGAASIYFDMRIEDENDITNVSREFITNFKEEGDNEMAPDREPLLRPGLYEADQFVTDLNVNNLDLDNEDLPPFSPHPVVDYMEKKLKRLYYNYQLRFFPAALLRKIISNIETATNKLLDEVSAQSTRLYKAAALSVQPSIVTRLGKVSQNEGALSYVEFLLTDMQELMSKERERVATVLESQFWNKILDSMTLPKSQRDPFEDYHEVYRADNATKNNGAGCTNMKQEVLTKLKAHLSNERTTLATLGRTVLLSILFVLSIVPLLDIISPHVIDLGDVKKYAFFWAAGVFMLPFIIQLVSVWFYLRKRRSLINILRAYYTHDAYARVANRIEFEANELYDKLSGLGTQYLKRCEDIRKEIRINAPDDGRQMLFPENIFNQPLNGGKFDEEVLIPKKEVEVSKIRINHKARYVNELKKSEYYLLINRYNDVLGELFKDVDVNDISKRRFDENTGQYVYFTQDEILRNQADLWVEHKAKFYELLRKSIKDDSVPREYPTVGDKLLQYTRKIDDYTLLKPLMDYAATNGEIVCEADQEFADIKVNRAISALSEPYLPLYTTRVQEAKFNRIYETYVFITRWRCFEHFSYNRILPTEDFDLSEFEKKNYDAELEAKNKRKKRQQRLNAGLPKEDPEEKKPEVIAPYEPCNSSLILWAVCPDENSSAWLKLFTSEHFGRAFEDREKYREVLNQND